jgi:hypothetical protein
VVVLGKCHDMHFPQRLANLPERGYLMVEVGVKARNQCFSIGKYCVSLKNIWHLPHSFLKRFVIMWKLGTVSEGELNNPPAPYVESV